MDADEAVVTRVIRVRLFRAGPDVAASSEGRA